MKKLFVFALFCFLFYGAFAQKKVLTDSVYDIWKEVGANSISNNGQWISYEINLQEAEGVLVLKDAKNTLIQSFNRGREASFSPNSDFMVFKIKPQDKLVRKAKLAKKSKDDLPKDSLGIFTFSDQKLVSIPKVKSFKVAKEKSSWIVYQLEKEKDPALKKDTAKTKEKKPAKNEKKPDAKLAEPSDLVIYNPASQKKFTYKQIVEYSISRNGKLISFIRQPKDTLVVSTVFVFDTETEKLDSIFTDKGISKKITSDNNGQQLAFLFSRDTAEAKTYHLYFSNLKAKQTLAIVDTLSKEISKGKSVSDNGEIYFSRDDNRLFFGTAIRPKKLPKDTLLDEEKVKVDIWNWKDPLIQPQQLNQLERELKRTYLAVYTIDKKKIVQLADSLVPSVRPMLQGNGGIALASSNLPYRKMVVYETPSYNDVYTIDLLTGARKLILKKTKADFELSPGGEFLIWFCNADSSWYSTSTVDGKVTSLTKSLPIPFYDEENDQPNFPDPYRLAGWTKNDEFVMIYDKYDIWKCDPTGKKPAICITQNEGRKNSIKFNYQKTDYELQYFPDDQILLKAVDDKSKKEGYFTLNLQNNSKPQQLIFEDLGIDFYQKAKNANAFLFSKSSFKIFPDLWLSDANFGSPIQLSNANPQQNQYNWGTVEMINWNDFNGKNVNGLLYKPENYDATKKYPMIIYFYERHTDNIHQHYSPRPSRSTINPSVYVSNGYLVLMPDITYTIGYPGDCAYNAVVSGAMHLIETGIVDKSKIGIQGQSWGGYQVAYLVTRTNLFAAANAGAPVSNMTSAYGGIRWESGMSRMFQYEQSQSRIGGTLWEKPLQYIENSPVFYAPKINTPLLIRHNDADGAVPWYQGIELFMALRRLEKPVWLINYNNGPHNITDKRSHQKDYTIRMQQFFDHYLKGAPAPKWMMEGVPAVEKGKSFGLEVK